MSKRGLIKSDVTRIQRNTVKDLDDLMISNDFDVSLTAEQSELRKIFNNSKFNKKILDSTQNLIGNTTEFDKYGLNSDNIYHKNKCDVLFLQFLEILQSRTNDSEVFDTIQDLIQTCTDVLDNDIINEKCEEKDYIWLQDERNTWRLLYCLYKDRYLIQKEDIQLDVSPLGASEKEVVTQLYSTNSNLREYQLIVDWLELCALENESIQVGHFTDRTVAWENTLYQLKNPNRIEFGGSKDIVKSLDPDAPIRERKSLHDLDVEDQKRLSRQIFLEIRRGRIEEAQSFCEHCGQAWRAAILEGWRLHDDPNYENGLVNKKMPIEGNPKRDIWKKFAWMMADSNKFDDYTRATVGILCGHLDSLLNLLDNSWEDILWAYLKVQIDIRVESEIRSCCMSNYLPLPDKYWNNKMSLEQIFDELSAHKNVIVKNSSFSHIHIIQKFLILDDIPEMMRQIQKWLEEEKLTTHMLRFLCHIILFMRQIGKEYQEEIADQIIKAYVENLIEIADSQLVAFYSAALPEEMQILLYSKYLETIKTTIDRGNALEVACSAGLDIDKITSQTVETICKREIITDEEKPIQGTLTANDEEKISCLEFLTFYPQHRGELIWQANILIRNFMAKGNIEAVRKAFEMIPKDSIEQIIAFYDSKENLPCREECCIKEYLCYQTYIAAIDGFNDWSKLYNNQPKQPQINKDSSNFTERIASEHKEQSYKAELDRWKINLEEQSHVTKDLLYNIILFPERGWLLDPETTKLPDPKYLENWNNRQIQLEDLRRLYIPEIILLLHKVMHLTGDYKSCMKLADELASETRQLYKIYSSHKLSEFLARLAETSLALLNKKIDPWGYDRC